jgi:hypothetical protein
MECMEPMVRWYDEVVDLLEVWHDLERPDRLCRALKELDAVLHIHAPAQKRGRLLELRIDPRYDKTEVLQQVEEVVQCQTQAGGTS